MLKVEYKCNVCLTDDEANKFKNTLSFIYDKVEIVRNAFFFVGNRGERFKLLDKTGIEQCQTKFIDLVAAGDSVFGKLLNSDYYSKYGRITTNEDKSTNLELTNFNSVHYKFSDNDYFESYELLPNGALLICKDGVYGVIGSSGIVILPNIYRVLKVSKVRSDNSVILYYVLDYIKDEFEATGTIVVSPDGTTVDKVLGTKIGSMSVYRVYDPNNPVKRIYPTSELLNGLKSRLGYSGKLVGKAYDEILVHRQLADAGFVKVVDYVKIKDLFESNESSESIKIPTIGVINVKGTEIIPTGYFSSVNIISKDIFVCKNIGSGYQVLFKGNWLTLPGQVEEVIEVSNTPIICLSLVKSNGNSEEREIVYYGNDGEYHLNILNAFQIWEYTPKKIVNGILNISNNSYYRVLIYGELYYTNNLFTQVASKYKQLLENVPEGDWQLRDFGIPDNLVQNSGQLVV